MFTIRWARPAAKAGQKLPKTDRRRVFRKVESLATNPRPPGVKKLKGPGELYRVRVGDFRIVYEIRDSELVVLVLRVGDRKDIYELVKNLGLK